MNRNARQSDRLVERIASLADKTRLRLLRLLERRELGVGDLCDVLQLPQSTVSRHLKILADQGWIHGRRDRTTQQYRIILDELDPGARKLWLVAKEQTDDWAAARQDELRLERRLQRRQSQTQSFFAGAAAKWDRLRREQYGESFATQALLALLPANLVVADLGCGTGQLSEMLAMHVARVIGIDASSAMLKAARKRLRDRENVELLRAELGALPLEDASCDAAALMLVLTYVQQIAETLAEAHRILKPGGKLIIVDLLPHDRDDFRRQTSQQHMGFAHDAMESALRAVGFADSRITPLPPEPNAKGPALFLATATK